MRRHMFSFLAAASCLVMSDASVSKSTIQMRYHQAWMVHKKALSDVATSMTLPHALSILRAKSSAQPFVGLLNDVMHGRQRRKNDKQGHLRKVATPAPVKGYAAVGGARGMLNDMIKETVEKYDERQMQCCDFDENQNRLIDNAATELAMYNGLAQQAREQIAEANALISKYEESIPKEEMDLAEHNKECKETTDEMKRMIKIMEEDLSVMGVILNMTNCKDTALNKTLLLLSCHDSCGRHTVMFHHPEMQRQAKLLQNHAVRHLLDSSLEAASRNELGTHFAVTDANGTIEDPTEPPAEADNEGLNACELPKPADGATDAGCSIEDSPNCPKMQKKFLAIKCGIEDKKLETEIRLKEKETECESIRLESENLISWLGDALSDQQAARSAAFTKMTSAEESAHEKSVEKARLDKEYLEETTACHDDYKTFESEECALKKIRVEIEKIQGDKDKAFFQDCITSEFEPDGNGCSKTCGGGEMLLVRDIVQHPVGGATCGPLEEYRACNEHHCPVDCVLNDWAGWQECDVKCGGGSQNRIRTIKIKPLHGGAPCGETVENQMCNMEACKEPCVLHDWTDWGDCNKQCGGGTSTRNKNIDTPAIGGGYCAAADSEERRQGRVCNTDVCPTKIECIATLDFILVIDGSGSLGWEGWTASKAAAKMLLQSFKDGNDDGNANIRVAIVVFSWGAVTHLHFDDDIAKAMSVVDGLYWPNSVTFTSSGLWNAWNELLYARWYAHATVILMTDGWPYYYFWTWWAAWWVRWYARLMVMPITAWAPTWLAWDIASYPKAQNYFYIDTFTNLESQAVINNVIEDVCPQVYQSWWHWW